MGSRKYLGLHCSLEEVVVGRVKAVEEVHGLGKHVVILVAGEVEEDVFDGVLDQERSTGKNVFDLFDGFTVGTNRKNY